MVCLFQVVNQIPTEGFLITTQPREKQIISLNGMSQLLPLQVPLTLVGHCEVTPGARETFLTVLSSLPTFGPSPCTISSSRLRGALGGSAQLNKQIHVSLKIRHWCRAFISNEEMEGWNRVCVIIRFSFHRSVW